MKVRSIFIAMLCVLFVGVTLMRNPDATRPANGMQSILVLPLAVAPIHAPPALFVQNLKSESYNYSKHKVTSVIVDALNERIFILTYPKRTPKHLRI